MDNLSLYEEIYHRTLKQLDSYPEDTVFDVDLALLKELRVLDLDTFENNQKECMKSSFYVVETPDKITLINEEFIVWITPKQTPTGAETQILIAINSRPEPKLELAFRAGGVYNRSGIVVKVLGRLLEEIHENERMMSNYLKCL